MVQVDIKNSNFWQFKIRSKKNILTFLNKLLIIIYILKIILEQVNFLKVSECYLYLYWREMQVYVYHNIPNVHTPLQWPNILSWINVKKWDKNSGIFVNKIIYARTIFNWIIKILFIMHFINNMPNLLIFDFKCCMPKNEIINCQKY